MYLLRVSIGSFYFLSFAIGPRLLRQLWIGHFWVPLCLCFKASLSAKPFLWLWFACMKIKLHAELIFIWKVSHLDSFWNRGARELGILKTALVYLVRENNVARIKLFQPNSFQQQCHILQQLHHTGFVIFLLRRKPRASVNNSLTSSSTLASSSSSPWGCQSESSDAE